MLDQWLVQIMKEKNAGEASKIAQKTFQNNIHANISYYEGVEKEALQNDLGEIAARNRAMVNLYKGFLKS